jgi:protein farnesyltransferase/geranylgeranyltransferase type-1 subunit alpha
MLARRPNFIPERFFDSYGMDLSSVPRAALDSAAMADDDNEEDSSSSNSWRYDIADLVDVFDDIEPLPVGGDNNDGGGVAAIDYTVEFRTAFGYFRALQERNERSPRALKLTATCLQLNAGNYTVWQYRRQCLDNIMSGSAAGGEASSTTAAAVVIVVQQELAFTARLAGPNPKNYQIWHHRRALLEKKECATTESMVREELAYLSHVLSHDSKNYHAWSHRMWLMGHQPGDGSTDGAGNGNGAGNGALWNDEMAFVEHMISEDARNNSAWNYRWFLLRHRGHAGTITTTTTKTMPPRVVLSPAQAVEEVDYVMASIEQDPYNESSWRFLVAMIQEQISSLLDTAAVQLFVNMVLERIEELGEGRLQRDNDNPHYMGSMVDIFEFKGEATSLDNAKGLCTDLAERCDAVRAAFWRQRRHAIEVKLASINLSNETQKRETMYK